jgi:methyltransferase (TIGR00027 family)
VTNINQRCHTSHAPHGLDPIEESALLQAWWRATEKRLPAPVLYDPLAEIVVNSLVSKDVEERFVSSPMNAVAREMHVQSAAAIDRALETWLAASPGAQIVNLGAGFDSRPHRTLSNRSGWFFHVDTPRIVDTAARLFPYSPHVRFVPANVARYSELATALAAAGLDLARPIAWIMEGLTEFLGERRSAELLEHLRGMSGRGSVMLLQVLDPRFLEVAERSGGVSWRRLPTPDAIVSALRPWRVADLSGSFGLRTVDVQELVHVYMASHASDV